MSPEHRAAEAIIDSCLLNEDIQLFNAPRPGNLHISPSKLIEKFTEAKKTTAPSLKKHMLSAKRSRGFKLCERRSLERRAREREGRRKSTQTRVGKGTLRQGSERRNHMIIRSGIGLKGCFEESSE